MNQLGTQCCVHAPNTGEGLVVSRRRLLGGTAAVVGAAKLLQAGLRPALAAAPADVQALVLETVTGPIKGSDVERAMAHEHLYFDLNGPTDPTYMDVDWSVALGASVNAANELRAQGVNLMIEWTNLGVGRNVLLLRHVARRAGLNIVCPTGIYQSLVPPEFAGMSIDELAAIFVRELTRGVDGTGIRVGFIKIATTEDGATESDTLVHKAAGIAARDVGCTIALHSPHFAATKGVVKVLAEEGVSLDRFVWGHAQLSKTEEHRELAARGATIQYDAISAHDDKFFHGPVDDESMLDRIEAMVKAGFDKQVIVSTDASVCVHPPKEQYDRTNTYLYGYFEAKLQKRLGEVMAAQVLRDNVIRAFRRGDKVA
jgi:predicted metal-dependent phosphotriesterase family hydrolase